MYSPQYSNQPHRDKFDSVGWSIWTESRRIYVSPKCGLETLPHSSLRGWERKGKQETNDLRPVDPDPMLLSTKKKLGNPQTPTTSTVGKPLTDLLWCSFSTQTQSPSDGDQSIPQSVFVGLLSPQTSDGSFSLQLEDRMQWTETRSSKGTGNVREGIVRTVGQQT